MSEFTNNNIIFLLEENDDKNNNEDEIQQIINEINNDIDLTEVEPWTLNDNFDFDESNLNYFIKKSAYGNDELFYEEEYTVKDLLKICSYYDIDKNIRTSKCKKPDIISTLVYFESLPENFDIVQKRNRMWAYISELMNDTKMKKYIIF